MSQQVPPYNLAAVRDLLRAAFTPQQLRRFCQDRPSFEPVCDEFSPNHGLNEMIDRLIDYCDTRLAFDELLTEISEANPGQYARFKPYLRDPDYPPPAPRPQPGPAVAPGGPPPARPRPQISLTMIGATAAVLVLALGVFAIAQQCDGPTPTPSPTSAAPHETIAPPPTVPPTSAEPGPEADTTSPAVEIACTPEPAAEGSNLICSAQASDDRDLERVELWLDGELAQTCPASGRTAECSVTAGPYQAGNRVRCEAYAYDRAGNQRQNALMVIVEGGPAAADEDADDDCLADAEDPAPNKPQITACTTSRLERTATLSRHTAAVNGVAFSPDGTLLASASADGTVGLWRVAAWSPLRSLQHEGEVHSLAFSPNGRWLAASVDRIPAGDSPSDAGPVVIVWEVSDWQTRHELARQEKTVNAVAFSSDSALLASASDDDTTELWRLADWSDWQHLATHDSNVNSVAFSPDGAWLATGEGDVSPYAPLLAALPGATWLGGGGGPGQDVVIVRSRADFFEDHFRRFDHDARVNCVAFSPDSSWLASASDDHTIRLWHVADGEAGPILEGHSSGVSSVAFSPDGSVLASASLDGSVRLWRVADDVSFLHRLVGGTEWLTSVAFSPEGTFLAAGSRDGGVAVWHVP